MIKPLKKYSFFIVLAIVIIAFLFITNDKEMEDSNAASNAVVPSQNIMKKEEDNTSGEMIAIVDVKGAVGNPGVYEMDIDSRVNDVIQKAEGFTSDADQSQVNLAQKVQDEMIIIIPEKGEMSEEGGESINSNNSDKIRINHATQTEIENLSGIGPSKAQAIIEYRDENGHFQSIEDLLEVSGIGEKTLENLREDIQVP
ncbi:helix-hairpin-helix domain-containing protein [Virgibacillus ainsalahensis]